MSIPSIDRRGGDTTSGGATGGCEFAHFEGDSYAVIKGVERLRPFLMNVVSDGDTWIFAGSNGGLTAGRRDPDGALFPYRPADQILHDPRGSGVACLIRADGECWEPWAAGTPSTDVSRMLGKHELGARVLYEETHARLGLRCRWTLSGSTEFGLVRHCRIENLLQRRRRVEILDGWHRLLPPGVGEQVYARFSYLAAAYMRHEILLPSGLLVSALNAAISDRPEPAESLRATVAWSIGHRAPCRLISDRQVDDFRLGRALHEETTTRGGFGSYLVRDAIDLAAGGQHEWFVVADIALDHAGVVDLDHRLAGGEISGSDLRDALAREVRGLRTRVGAADGLQCTADGVATAHHASNTLFNVMRGGVPAAGNTCPPGDLATFLDSRNQAISIRHGGWIATADGRELPAVVNEAGARDDPHLERLVREYLPLCFSRRHGDPSRPWNRFSIETRSEDGSPICGYAGNWRDIFQNWEALGHAHPTLLPAMVAAFLNATTADGYNAYRMTRAGIDWEVPNPDDPWSHIGYWGDHQVVYLLRLLEAHERFWPGRLAADLNRRVYAHAVVPYRIAPFDSLLRDPRHSIAFEPEVHRRLCDRAAAMGGDGRLLPGADGQPLLVSLAEKLIVPALVKLTNLVPGGGIWLNTQRPEWNDANNALAGWGLSVVTVCYLRRALAFLDRLLATAPESTLALMAPAAALVEGVAVALREGGDAGVMFERLGRVGERHRDAVYAVAFAETPAEPDTGRVATAALRGVLARGIDLLDETIRANRRADGLYHSYNVLELTAESLPTFRRLEPMLEGQVAALSSGLLSDREAEQVIAGLRRGPLYRADQRSYLLQPDHEAAPFLDRNRLPDDWRQRVPTLAAQADAGDRTIIVIDRSGTARFQADITNARDLAAKLDASGEEVGHDRAAALDLWEAVFHHRQFTGRSSSFFGFEGLGSIYWHMVAKLLLAVQECHRHATGAARAELAGAYHRIRDGLGFRKSPAEYGAFPTDAYSHTPRHAGAQQPGMTGQVKEELLTRLGEFGVEVEGGRVRFAPELLPADEILDQPSRLEYVDTAGSDATIDVPAGGVGFTFCQVPIIYRFGSAAAGITVRRGQAAEHVPGDTLPAALAEALFRRTGAVTAVEVDIPGDTA
jgi:hypothetical protein